MTKTMRVEDTPATAASALARQIDDQGFAVIPDYVGRADLDEAQAFVRKNVAAAGNNYTMFSGSEQLDGTFLRDLGRSDDFVNLCRGIYKAGTDRNPPNAGFYQILRCLSGTGAAEHSMRFHYDSYVLTALIPILMPVNGQRGNLIVLPNNRTIRKYYISNLCDKMLIENSWSQKFYRRAYANRQGKMVSIAMRPGSLYFFWGYRSLHTNEPCDPNEIRSTALFHYADPHADSSLKRFLRKP
jgi:hypothetical protein